MASSRREVRAFVEEYSIKGGKKVFILADGRLVNLSAAEGHPAVVMDMSFANQALSVEHLVTKHGHLPVGVHSVPEEIDKRDALRKLESMNIRIDKLTPEQEHYHNNWLEGT
jgi:adenosylhomocysteinase